MSAREREILGLMSKGLSNSEIALNLSLSLETIKWYNKQLFAKLGVGSRSQAVASAVETGILNAQTAPQARKETRPNHNLPASITSFIGREKEIQEVERLVSQSRLVTITGAGGVGKTRLAIQAAVRLAPQFEDGARWVPLASLAGAPKESAETQARLRPGEDPVTQAAARALRVPERPNLPLLQVLLDYLQDRQILLVFDNCEHLVDACAALAENLLGACPQVSILATSREALAVPGEKAWRLPSLSLPQAAEVPAEALPSRLPIFSADSQTIYQSEAVSLFLERAADVLPGFRLTDADAPILARICCQLDGIPLAIELAAARMSLLSPQEIADRLEDAVGKANRFNLLTGGRRTALPRHQTLRAAIEWSYNLLSETEQVFFRRVSVFAGSFTLEAVEAICASQNLPGDQLLTLLGRLVDKSLLNVEPALPQTDLATRYRCLDTIRSFGRLKLEEAGETGWLHDRYAFYYLHLVETAELELNLKNQLHWYRLLQAERNNIRAVVEWSVKNDNAEDVQAETALLLVGALLWYWYRSGAGREGLDLALKALSLPATRQYKAARARALNTAGFFQCIFRETGRARQSLEEAISILRKSKDEANLAWSLQFLGLVFAVDHDYDRADACFQEGLEITTRLEEASANSFLFFLGDVQLHRGQPEQAKSTYAESARMLRKIGSKPFLAYPLRRLGYLTLAEKDIPAARGYLLESLSLNHEVGDVHGVTASLVSFAVLAAYLGNSEAAARLCGVVESRLESLSMNLLFTDQAEYARLRAEIQNLLGRPAFGSAFAEGWEMSEEQAVALAEEIAEGVSLL